MLDLSLPTKVPDERRQYPHVDLGAFAIYTLVDLGEGGIRGLGSELANGLDSLFRDQPKTIEGSEKIQIPPCHDFSGQRLQNVYEYHLSQREKAIGENGKSLAEYRVDPNLFFVAYSPTYQQDGVILVNLDTDGQASVSSCPVEVSQGLSDAVNLQIANEDWEDLRGPMLPVHVPAVLPSMLGEFHELWGGHARAKLPLLYLDASEVRPVPDHQEIFINNDRSDLDCQNSLVVTLCEAVTNEVKSDYEALMFHIIDQLDDDGPCLAMSEAERGSMTKFPDSPVIVTSTMSKPKQAEDGSYNFVVQYFLLLRLVEKETDVLVTANVPHASVHTMALEKDPMTDSEDWSLARGRQMLETFADTFEIVDWSFLG